MPRNLARIPKGTKVFIDANIFHFYLRGPRNAREICANFLEKVESGEVIGYTSTLVIDELVYKLMLKRIEEIYRENPLKIIKKNRKVISEAADYVEQGLSVILGIENLRILTIKPIHLENMVEYMKEYSLLPRDSLHVALMIDIECRDIASADSDFDVLPGITRWTPLRENP